MINAKCTLNAFREAVGKNKCICFGCGLQGIRMLDIIENWGLNERIVAFVDNDEKKQGNRIKRGGCEYPILSVSQMLEIIDSNTIIIITNMAITEIRGQLNQYKELDEVSCYSLGEIAQQQLIVSDYHGVIRKYDEAVIPKKIHYMWLGGEMPGILKKNVEQWHELCPDYEIIKWDEKNYNFEKNSYMKEAFQQKKWGFVPDYARLDIVYHYGGIYLDTDVELAKKPDDLLYQDGFAISDSSLLMNFGAGFGAVASLPIIKELRDYYDTQHFLNEDGACNMLPCTAYSYPVLEKYGYQADDSLQTIEGLNIYPMLMGGTCIYTMQKRVTEKTYFMHYGTASWMEDRHRNSRARLSESIGEEKLVSYQFEKEAKKTETLYLSGMYTFDGGGV